MIISTGFIILAESVLFMTKKLTGIVVDDDSDIVELFSEFLEMKGFSVVGQAYNGCDAAKTYAKTTPDFVVLDMKMPEYDGDHAIREIKKINPDANIFVVTGYSTHDNLDREVTAVLAKPCDLSKLYDHIKKSVPDHIA